MVRRVHKKDACNRASTKLVLGGGSKVWVTKTSENTKKIIWWRMTVKSCIWDVRVNCSTRVPIDKIGGGGE
jgi:hypothetical protein